jgi:uncharacterized protein DUF5681
MTEEPQFPGTGRQRSLVNLAPPWRRGQSGNPAGRPRGSRNHRSVKAERIGKRAAVLVPQLISVIDLPSLGDTGAWQRRYRLAMAELMAGGTGVDDAETMAARALLGEIMSVLPSPIGDPHRCLHCGLALPRGRTEYAINQSAPVALGQGAVGWAHRGRCHALAAKRVQQRAIAILQALFGASLRL